VCPMRTGSSPSCCAASTKDRSAGSRRTRLPRRSGSIGLSGPAVRLLAAGRAGALRGSWPGGGGAAVC
jgi:hypothetical protein